jgi:hypothetical protein
VTLERLPSVLPAAQETPVMAAIGAPAPGSATGPTAVKVRARWLAADGSDRPDLAALSAQIGQPSAAGCPQAATTPGTTVGQPAAISCPQVAMLKTPPPGDYRLRREFVRPDGSWFPQPVHEETVRTSVHPLRANWLGTIQDGVVVAGAPFEMPVALENSGTDVWRAAGAARVQIGAYWTAPDGTPMGVAALEPLPADLAPGESVRLVARVTPPMQPGRYRLTWDGVKQGDIFARTGSPTLATSVTVVARQ